MLKENTFILYFLLSKDNPSIIVSRAFTSIKNETKTSENSATGLLVNISLLENNGDKKAALFFLWDLQDNLKMRIEDLGKEVSEFDKEFIDEIKLKHKKAFDLKLKDLVKKPKTSKKKKTDKIKKTIKTK